MMSYVMCRVSEDEERRIHNNNYKMNEGYANALWVVNDNVAVVG